MTSSKLLAALLLCAAAVIGSQESEAEETTLSPFESCPLGHVYNASDESCSRCAPVFTVPASERNRSPFLNITDGQLREETCYPGSYCVRDKVQRERGAVCTCEAPLTLVANRPQSCGMCRSDEECGFGQSCLTTGSHGRVCVNTCTHHDNCTAIHPESVCTRPGYMRTALAERHSVCGCNSTYDWVKGFGCVLKPNITEHPLQCHLCNNEQCVFPPFASWRTCDPDQVCFTRAVFTEWSPRRLNVSDRVWTDRFQGRVRRGCVTVDGGVRRAMEAARRNASEWQGCRVVHSRDDDPSQDTIECENYCQSRFCNWQLIDPIVKVTRPNRADHDSLIWLWLLLLLLLLLLLCCFANQMRDKRADEEDAPLKEADAQPKAADADYGSTGEGLDSGAGEVTATTADGGGGAGSAEKERKGSRTISETKDVTIKAQSRINTGVKKKPPTEVKIGSTTTTKTVPE